MAPPAAARLSLALAAWCALIVVAPPAAAQPDAPRGKTLYVESCASCHGEDARGTENGPPLTDSGAAAVDFYLRTGRMPLASSNDQAVRKDPAFSEDEIAEIVAYVAALGSGPPIPDVFAEGAPLDTGATLYIANCAPCHGAGGNGGAAGRGAIAPGLHRATPVEIAEAMLIGPGEMPRFGFSQLERDAVVAYVDHLDDADDPGGADIGGIGPVPEGFVAWGVGMLSLIVVSLLIGSRTGRGDER